MIPLRDNIRSRRTPFVSYALLAATGLVFLVQLGEQTDGGEGLVERFGMIPSRVFHPDRPVEVETLVVHPLRGEFVVKRRAAESAVPPWLTLLTCIFLHGGWLHFLGNMWFLWIFGDNVEDRLGHMGFLIFYLVAGVAASAFHLFTNASSSVPTIGASGAIAGIMGAYFLLYPHAKVITAVPIFVFIQIVVLPAPLFLGVWFLLQFAQGTLAITATTSGGVAWWAHIGGFVVGLATVFVLIRTGRLRREPVVILPGTDRFRRYGSRTPWR